MVFTKIQGRRGGGACVPPEFERASRRAPPKVGQRFNFNVNERASLARASCCSLYIWTRAFGPRYGTNFSDN